MAIPLWVPIAAAFIGTMMKKQSYDQSQAKQRSLTRDQIERDRLNRQIADNKINTARDAFGKAKTQGDMQAETAKLEQILKSNITNPTTTDAPYMARNAPQVFQDTEAAALSNAMADVGAEAKNLARMESFGRAMQLTDPAMRESRMGVRTAGNFMRGDQGPFQLELSAAKNQAYNPWGDILQQLGMMGLGGALRKEPDYSRDDKVYRS